MTNAVNPSVILSVILLSKAQNAALIPSTLASLKEQTMAQEGLEVIVVSTSVFLPFADQLRTTIARSHGEFIFIINAGDKIDQQYLKKSVLALKSNDGIGFTYSKLKKFGLSEISVPPEEFSARRFFFYNLAHGAVYNGSSLRRIVKSQSLNAVPPELIRHYLIVKIMSLGCWGKSLNDVVYYLLTDFKLNNISRSKLNYETLKLLRSCWFDIFSASRAQRRYRKFLAHGRENDWRPRPMERALGLMASKVFAFQIKYIPLPAFINFLFFRKDFKKDLLEKIYIPSEAESLCQFVEKPDYRALKPGVHGPFKNTIIFAHDAWVLGGGENVLLKWMGSTVSGDRSIKVIDIVARSYGNCAFMRDDFKKLSQEQYALDRLSEGPKQSLRICWDLIVSERPRVLFIMSNPYFYALAPLIKEYYPEVRMVDLLHNEYADDPGWFSISDEYKKYMDKRIVVSETWKKVLIEKYDEQEHKILVCENGVDVDKFDAGKYNKKELKEKYNLSPEKRTVTFIGRINRQKNPETFLRLASVLLPDSRFEFLFIGNRDDVPEYVQEIEIAIARLPNVRYFGASDNIPQFLAVTDVLILPSRFEGYPLISLEAAAMGVPIVAADIVGFREQVHEGKFGLLYESKSDEEDAVAIKDVLLNQYLELKECATRGRRYICETRDIRRNEIIYKKILSSLLEAPSSREIN